MIALLGLAQIPLGLTLYGSPLALFVLYALAVFALLVTYFILTHVRERRLGNDYDSRYSYGTGSVVEDRRSRRDERRSGGRTGNVIKGAIAGAGIYALANRFRRRSSKNRVDRADASGVGPGGGPQMVGHGRHSSSYVEDEKFSDYSRDYGGDGVWEDRLLRIAAPIGAAALVTRFFDRRYRDRESDVEEYGPPLGGNPAVNEGRREDGRLPPGGPIPLNRPLPENRHPLNQPFPNGQHPPNEPFSYGQRPSNQPIQVSQRPLHRRPSLETSSDYESASGEPRKGQGLRDGIATLGVFGLARSIFNRRRGRNQDQPLAVEQDARTHGGNLTGDGRPTRHHRPGSSSISSDTTSLTGMNHPHHVGGIPPIPAGSYPAGAAGPAVATQERDRNRNEELPLGGIPRNGQVTMPPIPSDPHGIFHADSSGSEVFIGEDGRNHWRHHPGRDAVAGGIAGGAVGLAAAEAAEASSSRRDQRDRRQSAGGGVPSVASPVSIKVKMHDDNRHVTLRRLPEAEAAAERQAREARRRSQERSGRRRGDSASSLSGTEGSGDRFRRQQFQERQQAEAMRIESERLAAARAQARNQNAAMNVPAPPPVPESSSNLRPPRTASIGSPGTYDGNTTEASADYANNRRRRRAERAQAKQAREAKGGKTVEFE